jgi:mxaK protein
MRRRWVHLAFGTGVLVCAGLAAYETLRFTEAERVNAAIVSANSGKSAPESPFPEAQLAKANLLAKRGEYDAAVQRYKVLSRGDRADLATAALYNAGNLHFREALKEGRDSTVRMLPLIELAKQSYRNALRRDPQSWDVRYNLDRALWLAPELDEVITVSMPRNAEDRVMSTLQSTRADLP